MGSTDTDTDTDSTDELPSSVTDVIDMSEYDLSTSRLSVSQDEDNLRTRPAR